MAKVSVLIPIYNVKKYLGQCLDSVISQTEEDIEIICVEDGSTDGSCDILSDYAKRDARIRVMRHNDNMGLCKSRKDAVGAATGEYILFVDSDDYIEPQQAAEKASKDLVVYYGIPGGMAKRHSVEFQFNQIQNILKQDKEIEIPKEIMIKSAEISMYASEIRYPSVLLVSEQDVGKALQDSKVIMDWVKSDRSTLEWDKR